MIHGQNTIDLTIAEIARRLGEQDGAVKSRLRRAREFVREYMIEPQATPKNHAA